MAAVSTFHHPFYTQTQKQTSRRYSTRTLIILSSQQHKSPEDSQGVIQKTVSWMISETRKMGKSLKPEKPEKPEKQKKGDVKDIMLMSLSFALYVYISQQMVCAYFAWLHVSLPTPSW